MYKSGIYAILNSITDKIYVGSAVNILYRWKNHRIMMQHNKHHSSYLQNAYNKYGKDVFIYTVLEYVEDKTKLIEREQYYLDLLKPWDREFGYNQSPTAGSCLGYIHSEETRILLSLKKKGRARTEAEKAAIKKGWEKRREAGPVSEETRKRQSEAHKNKKHTEEWKSAASERMKGNNFNSGRKQTEEVIQNRINKTTGRKRTLEQVANIAEGKRKAAVRREKNKLWEW